jgi:hypothetical protein
MSLTIGLVVIPCFGIGFAILGTTTGFATLSGAVTSTLVLPDLLTHSAVRPRVPTQSLEKSVHPLLVGRAVLKGRLHQVLVHLAFHSLPLVFLRKQCKQLGPECVMSLDLIRGRLVGLVLSQRGHEVRSRNYLDLLGWIAQEPRLLVPNDFETRIRAGIPNLWIRLGLLTQLLVDPIVQLVDPTGRFANAGMQRQLLFHKFRSGSPALLAGQHILDGIEKQLRVPQNSGVLAFGLVMSH